MDNILKIASTTDASKVAGMIAALVKEGSKDIKLQCIGAGCVNQGVKGVAIARGYVAPMGYDLVIKPVFDSIDLDGMQRTAMSLIVEVM